MIFGQTATSLTKHGDEVVTTNNFIDHLVPHHGLPSMEQNWPEDADERSIDVAHSGFAACFTTSVGRWPRATRPAVAP